MRFGILGSTEVRRAEGRPVQVAGTRLRGLLVMLLLDAGRVVPVDRLIDGLYGEAPPVRAANALQSQVSRLRALLGGDCAIERTPAGYRLEAGLDDVDVHRFARLVGEGRRALADGDPRRAATALGEALELWRGPALADVLEVPFAEPHARRLSELALAAREDRVEAELRAAELGGAPTGAAGSGRMAGQGSALVDEIRAVLAEHPLRERLWGQLMRALALTGRVAEALAAYEDARTVLAEKLGASPSPDLAAVHMALLRGQGPQRAAPAAASGVRAQLTSFIGRHDEIARARWLLKERRLVTMIGPGGAGKTRLATEVATVLDGPQVCFVEFAPLSSGVDVPQAVLAAIGDDRATLPLGRDSVDRVLDMLRHRSAVLILDNCEHVVHEAAHLADAVLAACPSVTILATSREQLGITGEVLLPVHPLAMPPEGVPLDQATDYDAVRLFADRAAAVRPGFTLDLGNLHHVVSICRTLDGLPLAIELAAARTRSMPVATVADKLNDRFRLLTGGSRTALPRHRTLHAVVAWSWDLLDERERSLARRLSVFASGATLEQAERVCGGDIVDTLAALVDKSLVGEVDGRYRMLETIRVFCAGRPVEAGEEAEFRHAHAQCFLDLVEKAEPHLRGLDQVTWIQRLIEAHEDIHAALRWAIESGDVETALRLVAGLAWYWWLRGLRQQGRETTPRVLALMAGRRPPAGLEAAYGMCVLKLAMVAPPSDELLTLLADADDLVGSLGLTEHHPLLAMIRPVQAIAEGDYETVTPAVLRATTSSDPWVRSCGHLLLGYVRIGEGQATEAETEFGLALDGFRRHGDRWGMVQAMLKLAGMSGWRGDHASAIAAITEALELVRPLDSPEDTAFLLIKQAEERLRLGDVAGSRADLRHAVDICARIQAPEAHALALCVLAETYRVGGELTDAGRLYERASAETADSVIGAEEIHTRIFVGLGRVAAAENRLEEAIDFYRQAFARASSTFDQPGLAHGAEAMASASLQAGEARQAATLLGAATVLRGMATVGDPDTDSAIARARAVLGDAEFDRAYAAGAAMTQEEAFAVLLKI
ncbi:BTAD domain-containing putative transcriptional regulator [Sinosporangium album]|nr:BTAD domain-containing putative transcriptional regulator [Sinosporangium album]